MSHGIYNKTMPPSNQTQKLLQQKPAYYFLICGSEGGNVQTSVICNAYYNHSTASFFSLWYQISIFIKVFNWSNTFQYCDSNVQSLSTIFFHSSVSCVIISQTFFYSLLISKFHQNTGCPVICVKGILCRICLVVFVNTSLKRGISNSGQG